MKQKAKPKAARRAAAKKPARGGAVSAKSKAKSRAAAAAKKAKTKPKVKVRAKAPLARKAARKAAPIKKATKTTSAKRAAAKSRRPAKTRRDQAGTRPSEAFSAPETEFLADFEAPAGGAAPGPETYEVTPAAELSEALTIRSSARRGPHGEAQPESGETPARVNKLVPTNAVHTTKRRTKRNTWQSPVLGLAAVAVVLGVLVLGHENTPPDVSPLERRAEATWGEQGPRVADPLQAAPERALESPAQAVRPAVPRWSDQAEASAENQAQASSGLKVLDLVEMERMLARLEMGPSRPDGIVDQQTTSAIRMYQQIAGLPVDGEPTVELLDDMREVVKLLDGVN